MTRKKKAVGNDQNPCVRPVRADERDELHKIWVDGWFAPQEHQFASITPSAPVRQPSIGRIQVEMAPVSVVGVMRAAFTSKVAGMRDVHFQTRDMGALDGCAGLCAGTQNLGHTRIFSSSCSLWPRGAVMPNQKRSLRFRCPLCTTAKSNPIGRLSNPAISHGRRPPVRNSTSNYSAKPSNISIIQIKLHLVFAGCKMKSPQSICLPAGRKTSLVGGRRRLNAARSITTTIRPAPLRNGDIAVQEGNMLFAALQ